MSAESQKTAASRARAEQPKFTRISRRVRSVEWAEETGFSSTGELRLSRDECNALTSSGNASGIRCRLVQPGESVRLVNVLDAVEPRTKGPAAGNDTVFPGFLGPGRIQGRGEVHVAHGVIVVLVGDLPRAQPAIADLAGAFAEYTPLGGQHLVVLEIETADAAAWTDVVDAGRMAALRVARWVADATTDVPPDEQTTLSSLAGVAQPSDLPRVGVVTNAQGQGAFKDVYFYGRTVAGLAPTLVDPNELEDGALVSGQYGHPGLRNPTYLYQNHPVVAALRAREGEDLTFAGLILTPEPEESDSKTRLSTQAAYLARQCGFDAAVVTKEGGGNADADLVLKLDELEDLGIATVGIVPESAGWDGGGPPLVTVPRVETSLVSAGNYDEVVRLPRMDHVIGGRVRMVDDDPHGELEVPLAALYCALSPLGWGRLASQEAG